MFVMFVKIIGLGGVIMYLYGRCVDCLVMGLFGVLFVWYLCCWCCLCGLLVGVMVLENLFYFGWIYGVIGYCYGCVCG